MSFEYATTTGALSRVTFEEDDTLERRPHRELLTPVPAPPEGEGWDLRGVANTDARVLWFWQRLKPPRGSAEEAPVPRQKRPRGRPRKARPAPSSQPALDKAVDKQMDRIG